MPPKLNVEIDGDATGLTTALGTASGAVGKFGLALNALKAHPVLLVVSAVAAAGVALGELASQGAAATQAENEFARAMTAAGVSADKNKAALDAAILSSQELAFTDDATRASLVALTTATGSLDASLDLLKVAQDVARASGVDLETASDAVAKAHAGQDRALRALLPGMKAGATAADTIAEAQRLAAGSADEYANSAQGMKEKGGQAFGELTETIGQELVPMMEDLLAELLPVIAQIAKLAMKVMPPFVAIVKIWAKAAGTMLDFITKIIDGIMNLIDAVGDAMKPIQDLINTIGSIDLNPLNHLPKFDLPNLWSLPGGPTATPMATTTGAVSAGGGVQINIYGDPAVIESKVTKALRDYARRNGQVAVFSTNRNR